LYTKFENQRVHYTFANYIVDAQAPYANLKTFWNPGVDANIVVANDIIFGEENPNNIILTGPNTGGKSTVIKSALINLLLAQTIGIAPCDEITFTLFAVLNCYLNITDDLSAGVSLFKAEVLRAKALIEAIRKLEAGQFSFTIMDEVFSGTSPKEGEEAAYMFAKELGIMQSSICTIATHFPKLTELEDMKKFKNYQVKVWKDENNNWVRPFKLEEGKSTLNIAMDLLEEAGIFSHA
jgi:DNA mismatch repair ATPase MutS